MAGPGGASTSMIKLGGATDISRGNSSDPFQNRQEAMPTPAQEREREKQRLIDESITALERYIPGVSAKIDWSEAATPRTVERYTTHFGGTSFGTKFEGLKVSMDLPEKLPGLYHAGSVGIIMSGWLGTINYGVIVANKVDKALHAEKRPAPVSLPA